MSGTHSTVREGVTAGLLGAATVALWFYVVDLVAGQPLRTPRLLGQAAFGVLGARLESAMFGPIIGYTVLHLLAFVGIGLVVALLVHWAEREPTVLAGLFLLFVVFEAAFYGLVALLSDMSLIGALAWYQIGLANLAAAGAMGTYLWRRHPGLAGRLDKALSGEA
jgi:hypothetical protein